MSESITPLISAKSSAKDPALSLISAISLSIITRFFFPLSSSDASVAVRGRIDAETAFRLSRIDEDFQIERWGQDDEARDAAESRKAAMLLAERLWHLSRRG